MARLLITVGKVDKSPYPFAVAATGAGQMARGDMLAKKTPAKKTVPRKAARKR